MNPSLDSFSATSQTALSVTNAYIQIAVLVEESIVDFSFRTCVLARIVALVIVDDLRASFLGVQGVQDFVEPGISLLLVHELDQLLQCYVLGPAFRSER